MYAYSGERSSEGAVVGENGGLAQQYMTNTSTVPILRPVKDFFQHRDRYPDFFDKVWPDSLEAVLEAGDMLVMPPAWWHAMRPEGNDPCWSVSMCY